MMNQEVPPSDLLFGVVVTVVFLIFVFALGYLIYRFKNYRFDRAWAHLIPLVNGTVTGDGGGGATSWLTGTYRDQRMRSTMIPNRNRYSGESGSYYNYFDVALLDVLGKQDWRIAYHAAILGFGKTGWQIEAADPALKERLQASEILNEITRMGSPEVKYQARDKVLLYSEDVTPLWVPSVGRFQEELELLVLVARVNREVNP